MLFESSHDTLPRMSGLLHRCAACVALFASAVVLTGCTITVTPPSSPVDPVTVYLIDHGRHSSLVLPREDGTMTEYAFGEWEWFAKMNDGLIRAPFIMLIPSQGTLGRRTLDAPATRESVLDQTPLENLHVVIVERSDATALLARLDARFDDAIESAHHNEVYGLTFVKDEADYCLFSHCNAMTEKWLRELDCRTSGMCLDADFRVKEPEARDQLGF